MLKLLFSSLLLRVLKFKMVRDIDYESRRRAVLTATINRYIKEAIPVASEDVARDFDLSSATIRNIFGELEEEGYLTHPYTSAGRIPTYKGWRCYVDSLISTVTPQLLNGEKKQIVNEYKSKVYRLENLLEKTSEIISTVTHYVGITSFLGWQDKFFYRGMSFILEQPEFQDFKRMQLLIKVFEERSHLLSILKRNLKEKVKIYIDQDLGYSEMENFALVISSYSVKDKPKGRLAVLGPVRMEYNHIISALEYISEVLTDTLSNKEETKWRE